MPDPDPDLAAFAARLLPAGPAEWTRLSGGVSCQAWRVAAGDQAICVKRALPRLAVADDWRAPVSRALTEYRWFETARILVPGSAPRPLAVDAERGFIAMSWLDSADHVLWKAELLAGRADPHFAAAVGTRIGAIHAASARRPALAERFAADEAFHALRLEPYLLAAGRRRPAVAAALESLADRTARQHLSLVHGDVSPKNIMTGPAGPVFLDAETACWGDPAFDAAFCLNHLMLKQLVVPGARPALRASFDALAAAWLAQVRWEAPAAAEARAASLLPGLLLARIDGKSPVEYVRADAQRTLVRQVAEPLLLDPPGTLEQVARAWRDALSAATADEDVHKGKNA